MMKTRPTRPTANYPFALTFTPIPSLETMNEWTLQSWSERLNELHRFEENLIVHKEG